jgi:hypothetical protein
MYIEELDNNYEIHKKVDISQAALAKIAKNKMMPKTRPDNDIQSSNVSSPLDRSLQDTDVTAVLLFNV